MDIYARAVKTVEPDDRPELYSIYLARAAEFLAPQPRDSIHEQAIHALADKYVTLAVVCVLCVSVAHCACVMAGLFRRPACGTRRWSASWVD